MSKSRNTFVIVLFLIMVGVILAAARYGIWAKPWRASQIILLVPIALFIHSIVCWYTWRLGKLFVPWSVIVIIFGICTAGLYLNSYYIHQRQNLPDLLDSIDTSRIHPSKVKYFPDRGNSKLLREELFRYFRERDSIDPRIFPSVKNIENKTEILRNADPLIAYGFQFGGRNPVRLTGNLSWSEDPFGDVTWVFSLHSMRYLSYLLKGYMLTDNLKYLERAEELIFDWIEDNSGYVFEAPSAYSWGDHSTAIRVSYWLPFWQLWIKSPLCNNIKMEIFLRSMVGHAEKLSDSKFYTDRHNHGIDQDIALILLSSTFPEFKKSYEWRSLALSRLKGQLESTISPNGIHLEHSPGYQLTTLNTLSELYEYAGDRNIPEVDNPAFENMLKKMARFIAYLIQPDGRLPPIGDTDWSSPITMEDMVLPELAKKDPFLLYMFSRGRDGIPVPNVVTYPEEGYVIIRDSWGKNFNLGKSLQIIFNGASNKGLDHKHKDDMSFSVFCDGVEILVDPGKYSYKRDPNRNYIISSYAHNVVVVDNEKQEKGYNRGDGKEKIEYINTTDNYVLIRAKKEDTNIIHIRTLFYVRPDKIIVIDELMPYKKESAKTDNMIPHTFRQLFHFGPDMDIRKDDTLSSVYAYYKSRRTDPVLEITQLRDGYGTAEIFIGSKDPFQGWVSRTDGEIEPAPVAQFTSKGIISTFITFIRIKSPNFKGINANKNRKSFKVETSEQHTSILWKDGNIYHNAMIYKSKKPPVLLLNYFR